MYPDPHHLSHEKGGADEISIEGLQGEAAGEQNAGKIKGVIVDDTDIGDQKVQAYDQATDRIVYIKQAAPGINISGATAFTGTSPTVWTDLDLSPIIGANSALVILSISAYNNLDAVAVRRKGDTAEYFSEYNKDEACGAALGRHNSIYADVNLVLICVTDTNGIAQWITENSETATVKVIAYLL